MAEKLSMAERIAKLLDIAASSTHADATLAQERAERLMAQWGIDEATARAAGTAPKEALTQWRHVVEGQHRVGHSLIISVIAQALGCVLIQTLTKKPFSDRYAYVLSVAGFESDVARVVTLQEALIRRAMLDADAAAGSKASFLKGFAWRLRKRFEEFKTEALKTPGTALVLANRDDEVNAYVETEYGKLGKASKVYAGDRKAFDAGVESASRASIGVTEVGHRRAVTS